MVRRSFILKKDLQRGQETLGISIKLWVLCEETLVRQEVIEHVEMLTNPQGVLKNLILSRPIQLIRRERLGRLVYFSFK